MTESILIGGTGLENTPGAILASPQERAAMEQQQKNFVGKLRLDLAASIMAHLMGVQYNWHLNSLAAKAGKKNPHAKDCNGQPQANWESMDVSLPAALARDSADALLVVFGIIRPRQPESPPADGGVA